MDERGACTKLRECDCWFPRQLDEYTLTSSYVEVTRSNGEKYCGVRSGKVTKTKNRLHVSQISSVDSFHIEEGCFTDSYTEVHVRTGDESGSLQDDEWRMLGRESRCGRNLEIIKRPTEDEGEQLKREIENAMFEYSHWTQSAIESS